MNTAIVNGRIILSTGVLEGCCLLIQDGKIVDITSSRPPKRFHTIDASGCYVSPGFIDIHLHGGGGHDFMDGTIEAIEKASIFHLQHGTTSMVPTTMSCPNEDLFVFFNSYRIAKKRLNDYGGPNLLGIHLEGPFFSTAQRGAQDSAYLRNPTPECYFPILNAGGEDIVIVSAAPELPGALELGDELKKRGILASIGHSDAEYSDVCSAVRHGYSHVTHLYSGMSGLHRVGPYRHLGVIESSYLIDELTVEIIADGIHLPVELLKLITKCKQLDNISLITDSMRGAGLLAGQTVRLGSLTHGMNCSLLDNVAMMPDGGSFAGSVCTADRCIRTMYHQVGVSLPAAVDMMSRNPAKVLGISNRKGALAIGMDADICIFDEEINILKVFTGDGLVWEK